MANVQDAYCALEDLRTGDIATPSYTSKDQYIQNAAKEIDAALGHLYITPIVIPSGVPANRPAILYLEKINWLLASGRFILDVAAAGESANLHAYGKRMLDEAAGMIEKLCSEEYVMVGAPLIPSDSDEKPFTGPAIFNEDPVSMVQQFYEGRSPYAAPPVLGLPYVRPYGFPEESSA